MSSIELPPELEGFTFLLAVQLPLVREAFQYCLYLMMIETDKMRLLKTLPGEITPLYVFETSTGDQFIVARPNITPQQEAEIKDALRDILRDADLL